MRCSCRNCGAYMVQTERGLFSGCQCPECFNICRDCMGTPGGPVDKADLKKVYERRREEESLENGESASDWRKFL